jgi:hypothetical protein
VRVQLKHLLWLLVPSIAQAQSAEFNTTHGFFHESPTRTNMTVYNPGAAVQATPWQWMDVRAGWTADVVSGASVATKAGSSYAATHPGVDVVSTASVKDFRNVARGGFTFRKDVQSIVAGYAYSTENDYKSHAINVAARTEPYDRNTQLEIAYARNFDRVCDRVQSAVDPAARFRAMEDSKGCFANDPLRTSRGLDIDSFQGSWTQAWTPVLLTQAVYTFELLNGFQSNPYRSVVLGEGLKTQEHVPENRARHAIALRTKLYVRGIKTAFKLGVRGYWDTWDVLSAAVEVEGERAFGDIRLALRGRFYKQGGALFWSDDYTGGDPPLGPKGQYWTGDRELSPFHSFLGGLRAVYTLHAGRTKVGGFMTSLKLGASFDMIVNAYDEFTLGGEKIQNARALVGSLSLTATF